MEVKSCHYHWSDWIERIIWAHPSSWTIDCPALEDVFVAVDRRQAGMKEWCDGVNCVAKWWHFVTEFVHFILGDDTEPETEDTSSGHRLRRRLIERCDHISDEACNFYMCVQYFSLVIIRFVFFINKQTHFTFNIIHASLSCGILFYSSVDFRPIWNTEKGTPGGTFYPIMHSLRENVTCSVLCMQMW